MSKTLNWDAAGVARPLSATMLYVLAAGLRAGSEMLTRLATHLSTVEVIDASVQTVEFHAIHRDAGAPEGALYVNGKLVGVIEGVTRL